MVCPDLGREFVLAFALLGGIEPMSTLLGHTIPKETTS